LLVKDILRLVIFEWSDADTTLTIIGICQDWYKYLTSLAPNINIAWRSLYLRTWPFIRVPNDSIARFDWRLMILHHRLLIQEIQELWKLVHQRIKQAYIEKRISNVYECLPLSCTAAELVAWQESRQALLPIDFCFSMLTCGGEDVWKDVDMPNHYKHRDQQYKPIETLQASCYSEFDHDMDKAKLTGPLRFVVDPKVDPAFVVIGDYVCDYVNYIVMQVVDTDASSSSQVTSDSANSRRSSKRIRTNHALSSSHINDRYPSSYHSFTCSCLESRCNCSYSRLHGLIMAGHSSYPVWWLAQNSWLDWLRTFRKESTDSSYAFGHQYTLDKLFDCKVR
jgi:hypothetical protein